MDKHQQLKAYIATHQDQLAQVVEFNPNQDKLLHFNFTASNTSLNPDVIVDTTRFSEWINSQLATGNYRYGIGGYMEHRTLYARSALFDTEDDQEPRRLHLGIDIWAPAGTPIYTPLAGHVHSFQDNNHFGDYGPTIILEHDLNGLQLYSLYGHLSRQSLAGLAAGTILHPGQQIATLGHATENGSWPPHLHFQLMFDMQGRQGDYPGVGQYSAQETYRRNIPDPNIILRFPEQL